MGLHTGRMAQISSGLGSDLDVLASYTVDVNPGAPGMAVLGSPTYLLCVC
jgi:hypothetical protein